MPIVPKTPINGHRKVETQPDAARFLTLAVGRKVGAEEAMQDGLTVIFGGLFALSDNSIARQRFGAETDF